MKREFMPLSRTLMICDNDRKTCDLVSAFLTYQGYDVLPAPSGADFFDTVREKQVGIMIADLQYLSTCANNSSDVVADLQHINPALVMIGYSSEHDTVQPAGAENLFFLPKPINLDELESLVMRAMEYQAMKLRDTHTGKNRHSSILSSTIIGKSKPILSLFETIEKVAESNATILIQGESGTGKELAARAIHQLSDRSVKNFVPVNCGAIPEDLLESELFGHMKGSFTGAYANRIGRFEMADKGTLFLDEIGDMKASLQVKLLRVLQNREIEPVGSTRSHKVDVRIIAATNQNLEEMVAKKDFREDLYYRLSVIPITMPPLRDRKDDIPLLIHTFLTRFNNDRRHSVKGFSRETLEILCDYDWPGNVRELENLVERLVTLKNSGFIAPDDLPDKYLQSPVKPVSGQQVVMQVSDELPANGICLNSAVDSFERNLITQALHRVGGNKKEAALLLNLKRTTLIEKLKKKNMS